MISNQPSSRKPGHTTWVAAALLASLASVSVAHAAGLGRINVLSRLGQPFAAEIDLINVSNDELASLRVNLASPAAYQAANLRFDPALNALRLSVERRANGTPYVRATSSRNVTEPYLDLLVEAATQEGKLQRAYAALLDLPETAAPVAASPAVASPTAAAPAPKADVIPPRTSQTPPARARAEAAAPAPVAASKVVAAAPAPVNPPPRVAPAPAVAGNNTVAALETRPTESAKPESPKLPPAAAVVTETPKVDSPTPAAAEPAAAPAPVSQTPAPPKAAPSPAPTPLPEQGFIATLKQYLVPIGAAGLAGLVGLWGLWALRRRQQAPVSANEAISPAADTDHPATPWQDTTAAALATDATHGVPVANPPAPVAAVPEATVASVTDSVDPIDEAKVYIEYGQSEAAEKTLRAAMNKEPGREDIALLLLEVLAGRGDKDGFNQLARRLHKQTGGLGANWKRAMAMGYALDPGYPLYLPDEASTRARNAAPAAVDPGTMTDGAPQRDDNTLDFEKTMVLVNTDVVTDADVKPAEPAVQPAASAKPLPDINFEFPQTGAATPASDRGLDIEVDFSSMKLKPLDVPVETPEPAAAADDAHWEAVQQQIELARAYREMGDKAGALELLHEAERDGDEGQQAEVRELLQMLQ